MRISAVLALMMISALAVTSWLKPAPVLIWNDTASIPRGLYLWTGNSVELGNIVAINPGVGLGAYLNERGYLPQNVPLMKQVAGMSGDHICRSGSEISVNSAQVAIALATDSQGRILPVWQRCFILSDDEMFLLGSHQHSLDGRYFGPIARDNIIGTYRLVWGIEQ